MSEFSRETLLNIIETDHVQCGEASALARMALAAMDSSESVELPLDYLQGHKDGLEWASQLAEANHPETGDWLYDDPIALAAAIRKGPDMPEFKSVSVDEDDNFYSWFGREWAENYQHNQYTTAAKQMLGVMAESAWKAATERQRQKQNVSVPDVKMYEDVPYEVGRLKTHRDCYCDGWNACRAAMLQAEPVRTCPSGDGSLRWPCPVHPGNSPAQSDCCPAQNVVAPAQSPIDHGYRPECECSGCKATARICAEMAVNSLVIPNEMTSGQAYEIGYYYGDPVDVFARGANWMRQHIIDSTLAAAPQSPGSEPATVPSKWIPVSEQMPPSRHEVLVGRWWGEKPRWCCKWATYIPGHPDAQSSGWLIPGASWTPTHWMPLPAAPQEVR